MNKQICRISLDVMTRTLYVNCNVPFLSLENLHVPSQEASGAKDTNPSKITEVLIAAFNEIMDL